MLNLFIFPQNSIESFTTPLNQFLIRNISNIVKNTNKITFSELYFQLFNKSIQDIKTKTIYKTPNNQNKNSTSNQRH
ncbi:hypothetical protein BBI01_12190 [Chryseobacterium artocarpi]|uniref:Uncharacterized protein n=1 Tax=Chryseobacterium artocarpi TaxID=1414727 RepID=A0A1B8ZGG9_9FLAO|nr:hypothetical protein BBI01_12190 [Chryseobacterium artocarpi]